MRKNKGKQNLFTDLSSSISLNVLLFLLAFSSSSCSVNFFTSTTLSMMCSWRFLRQLFQLSKFWKRQLWLLSEPDKYLQMSKASHILYTNPTCCQSSISSRISFRSFLISSTFFICSCAFLNSGGGATLTNCKGLVAGLGGGGLVTRHFVGTYSVLEFWKMSLITNGKILRNVNNKKTVSVHLFSSSASHWYLVSFFLLKFLE